MKTISTLLLLVILAALARSTKIQTTDQTSFLAKSDSEGFLCPDLGWRLSPLTDPAVYQVMWCYSGSGCNFAKDYVYVTVKSSIAYVQCRATTANILKFAFGLAFDVLTTIATGGMNIKTVVDLVQTGIGTARDILTRNSKGDQGCYCFAERWTIVSQIFATVISDGGASVTIEVPQESLSQVNSEKVYKGTLLKISPDSCTKGKWKTRICDKYEYIRTKREISWSDLADELAWLGDRLNSPGSLFIFKPNPADYCKDQGTKSVSFSKKWCFSNSGCVTADDFITASYIGSATITCKNAYDPDVPYIGTFMTTAFKSYLNPPSGCICYPENFSSYIRILVEDDSGDWARFKIDSSYFDRVGIDRIEGGVRAYVSFTSPGKWRKNIKDKWSYGQTLYRYDWDEFGDDIAWWGDRNSSPDGLIKGR